MLLDPADLIGADDIAEMLGYANARVVSVVRSRHDDFPEPVVSRARCTLWLRQDIEAWASRRRAAR